jgi:hypothetical protein
MGVMANANCWEAKRCGRQAEGAKVAELGVCPASKTGGGANQGTSGGRVCWAIAGTLCSGQVQGTFAQKAFNCMQCDFYQAVKKEEGQGFRLLPN